MRILMDMDGPMAAFDDHFFDRVAEQGYELDIPGADGQVHRYATDHVVSSRERKHARRMTEQPGWFRNLPRTPGARRGMERLVEAGHDVWICTKPMRDNPTCRDEKAQWVEYHYGSDWVRRLIITPDKSMVVGDVLVDDAPYIEWLDRAIWKPAIFPRPWNGAGSKWEGLPRWGWDDPVELLEEIANMSASPLAER